MSNPVATSSDAAAAIQSLEIEFPAGPKVTDTPTMTTVKSGRGRPKGARNKKKSKRAAAARSSGVKPEQIEEVSEPVEQALEQVTEALEQAVDQVLQLGESFVGGPPEVWAPPPPKEKRTFAEAWAVVLLPHLAEHAEKATLGVALLALAGLVAPRVKKYNDWKHAGTLEGKTQVEVKALAVQEGARDAFSE